ncbi:MAG: tyrosine-type recombinase/integrase [Motiliproteus sp.]
MAKKKLKPGTIRNAGYRLNTLVADLGALPVGDLTVQRLSNYLDETFSGDPYIKHRTTLVDICRWGITKGLLSENPAEQTLAHNTAEKQRLPMTLDDFHAIRAQAQPWLQLAMDTALLTLQRRGDLCKMRYDDIRDGRLFVVQEKTEKHGVRAHLSIEMSSQLEGIIARSRADGVISPFIVHERPDRIKESKQKQHWSQVLPDRMSKQFAKARDALPKFANMTTAQRPGLHEIRALGGWLYLEQGYSKEYVNLLMGHTTMAMTEHYTDRHIEWTTCKAELSL